MTCPSRHIGHGQSFAVCPSVQRPKDRETYWRELGVPDPLRCETCGMFRSQDAPPDWRCECQAVPSWAVAAAREIVYAINLDGRRHLNEKAARDFAKIIATHAAREAQS